MGGAKRLVLQNASVLTRSGAKLAEVVVVGDRISHLIRQLDRGLVRFDSDEAETLDLEGLIVAPGLIDTQINGGFGLDFTSEPEAIWGVGARLPEFGITSFLPTIITSAPEATSRAQDVLASRPDGYAGAEPLGLHFEGPMLNVERKGAHDGSLMRLPSAEVIEGWSRDRGVAMVTLAPELDGAGDVVRTLVERRIVVSMGHSQADWYACREAAMLGANHVTHLYNAMSPFNHRDPGMVGFSLDSDDVTCGIISDGVHCTPLAVRLAWKAKGPDGLVLVSDAVAPMGLGDGHYSLGGYTVESRQGTVRGRGGELAGSAVPLIDAVRRFQTYTGCSLHEAFTVASTNPARLIRQPHKGVIRTGADADLVVLEPDLTPVMTIIGGRIRYQADTAAGRSGRKVVSLGGFQWK